MQFNFTKELLNLLKKNGIHTAIDTCGRANIKHLDAVLPYTDCVLYDVKIFDNTLHKKFTGYSNKMIIDNLLYLFDYINQHNEKQIWIRTPIIPGFTDSEKNISDIADFLHEHSNKSVSRWELCAFNNACNKKYKQLGKKWLLEGAPLITNRKLQQLKAVAEQSGIESIITSGITILE